MPDTTETTDAPAMERRQIERTCTDCNAQFATEQWLAPWKAADDTTAWVDIVPGSTRCTACASAWADKQGIRERQIDTAAAEREQAAAQAIAAREAARLDLAIPMHFRKADWQRATQLEPRVTAALADWHTQPDSVYLHGASGGGKSMLAAALIARLMTHRPHAEPVWHNSAIMLDRIRRSINKPERTENLVEQACGATYLVLDDLGAEKPSVWVLDRLYVILQSRIEHELPTIVTSNFSLSQLESWWQQGKTDDAAAMATTSRRITSRLRELCRLLPFEGTADQRLEVPRQRTN